MDPRKLQTSLILHQQSNTGGSLMMAMNKYIGFMGHALPPPPPPPPNHDTTFMMTDGVDEASEIMTSDDERGDESSSNLTTTDANAAYYLHYPASQELLFHDAESEVESSHFVTTPMLREDWSLMELRGWGASHSSSRQHHHHHNYSSTYTGTSTSEYVSRESTTSRASLNNSSVSISADNDILNIENMINNHEEMEMCGDISKGNNNDGTFHVNNACDAGHISGNGAVCDDDDEGDKSDKSVRDVDNKKDYNARDANEKKYKRKLFSFNDFHPFLSIILASLLNWLDKYFRRVSQPRSRIKINVGKRDKIG